MALNEQMYFSILLLCAIATCSFASRKVIDLNEGNWRLMLKNEWMVEFYAPWCPACKGLESTWKDFATWSDDIGISVGKIDVTTSPGLSGRFMVTALPTIFHVLNGEFRQYKGARDKDALISFVDDKKWKQVEAISSWQSPDSIQMSVVSTFFTLSQLLRQVHTSLMEEYGLPSWGSYLIFSVATIFIGAVLGLILVCLIDLIYPQKSQSSVTPKMRRGDETVEEKKQSDTELSDDDIKDDLVDDASQTDEAEMKSSSDEAHADERTNSSTLKKRRSRKE